MPIPLAGRILDLPIDSLDDSPFNTRKTFGDLQSMANTIRTHGVMQPLLVRRLGERFEIIYGHRRIRAARLAGLATVPVIVEQRSDDEVVEMQLIENAKREDTHPLDQGEALALLRDRFRASLDHIARRVGMSDSEVSDLIRLASELVPEAQAAFRGGKIAKSHAVEIMRLAPDRQIDAVRAHGSVWKTVGQLRRWITTTPAVPRADTLPFEGVVQQAPANPAALCAKPWCASLRVSGSDFCAVHRGHPDYVADAAPTWTAVEGVNVLRGWRGRVTTAAERLVRATGRLRAVLADFTPMDAAVNEAKLRALRDTIDEVLKAASSRRDF